MRKKLKRIVDEFCNGNQREFSKSIGVQESTVSMWLNEDKLQLDKPIVVKSDALKNICDIYKINLNWLLCNNGEMKIKDENAEFKKKRESGRRDEDKELVAIRDKFIECIIDISDSHSHIWKEVIKIKNN